jgi:large subunit ribosomal protein L23
MSEEKPKRRTASTKRVANKAAGSKRSSGTAKPRKKRVTKAKKQKEEQNRILASLSASNILLAPLATEKTIGMIERFNTLSFIVNPKAIKPQIKRAVESLYSVKVYKVRVLNSVDNKKKAFVRLNPEFKAQEIATRMGIL